MIQGARVMPRQERPTNPGASPPCKAVPEIRDSRTQTPNPAQRRVTAAQV